MDNSPTHIRAIAYYDEVGDAQCYYMPEFALHFDGLYLSNMDDILQAFCAGIFSHEDLHQAIVNTGIDSGAGQEHDLMAKVTEWLNKVI